jgi:hypothetical protein
MTVDAAQVTMQTSVPRGKSGGSTLRTVQRGTALYQPRPCKEIGRNDTILHDDLSHHVMLCTMDPGQDSSDMMPYQRRMSLANPGSSGIPQPIQRSDNERLTRHQD